MPAADVVVLTLLVMALRECRLGLLWRLPHLRGSGWLFDARVEPDAPARGRIVARYRAWLLGTALAVEAAALADLLLWGSRAHLVFVQGPLTLALACARGGSPTSPTPASKRPTRWPRRRRSACSCGRAPLTCRSRALLARAAADPGRAPRPRRADPSRLLCAGLFCWNPDEPAVLVDGGPLRSAINLVHPTAWLALGWWLGFALLIVANGVRA